MKLRIDVVHSRRYLSEYLQDLSEALLFLLLPPEDFHNKPFRYIVRVGVTYNLVHAGSICSFSV